jgi:hypothetical protein
MSSLMQQPATYAMTNAQYTARAAQPDGSDAQTTLNESTHANPTV